MLLRSVAFLWAVATACKSNLEACFDTWFGGKWLHVANLDFINGHCDEFVLDQVVGKYMDYVAHCCICISYLLYLHFISFFVFTSTAAFQVGRPAALTSTK